MKRFRNVKILLLFVIIVVGTLALTSSWSITLGVAILMIVIDKVVGAWADKKDEQYFGKQQNSDAIQPTEEA